MQRCTAGDLLVASLQDVYRDDSDLLDLHKEELLVPGWAGFLRPPELDYIKSELRKSPSLRRRWGFRPSAKRLSESHIRHVAMYGLQKK